MEVEKPCTYAQRVCVCVSARWPQCRDSPAERQGYSIHAVRKVGDRGRLSEGAGDMDRRARYVQAVMS